MLAQQFSSQTAPETRSPAVVWPVAVALLGSALALSAGALLPQLAGLALVALWPLGLAAAAFVVAFVGSRLQQAMLWRYLIGGQLLALVGVSLLLAAI